MENNPRCGASCVQPAPAHLARGASVCEHVQGGMSRVLCRRGVPRGSLSRTFSADELLDALDGKNAGHVYVELDSGGWMSPAGVRNAASLCVHAALAPHALCASALLTLAQSGNLRLRAASDLAPHAELLLWFAEDTLAALNMPFLTPRHIRGRRYACHACGRAFDDPNPLKVHMFLSCAAFENTHFWREVAARLLRVATTGALTTPARTHATPAAARHHTTPASARPLETPAPARPLETPAPARPLETPAPARPHVTPAPAVPLAPAELEALATEWGRARGGHVCLYCGKLYSRRYGLKIHLRTHTGYRPLRCRHCMRAFGDPSNLNKHERLHAARTGPSVGPGQGPGRGPGRGPARYSCPLCGRALARRRDLERHLRTHTHTQTTEQ